VIVVATADFYLYHEVVTALRDRGVDFTTVDHDTDCCPLCGVAAIARYEVR
jgi:uncharacterized protein (UPF0212 family)